MRMSEAFEAELALLRNRGALQDINPGSLPTQIIRPHDKKALSIFVVSCCDGHQNGDIHRHVISCCAKSKARFGEMIEEDCYHWKTCNGGPLVLSIPEIQTQVYKGETLHLDLQLFGCFEESRRRDMKGMDAVLLIGHARCAKADPYLSSLNEYCNSLVDAKKRFMVEFGLKSPQVITWLQTHRANGERKAYHVNYSTYVMDQVQPKMRAHA